MNIQNQPGSMKRGWPAASMWSGATWSKHELMAEDAFSFLRATFYRWIHLFLALCPKLAGL